MTESFPNNSERAKSSPNVPPEVDKQIEKIISGEAQFKKPSGFKRFRHSFIAGDASSVGEHVFWNLVIPRSQDLFAELLNTAVDMMIYGERRPGRRSVSTGGPISQTVASQSRMQYGAISSGGVAQSSPIMEPRQRPGLDEIYVSSHIEADAVLNRMRSDLAKYKVVTVADLYQMIGHTPNPMDFKWGWTNLDAADARRRGGATLIHLPTPEDIA